MMLSLLPSFIVLGGVAVAAALLARRRSPPANSVERLAAAHAIAIAVVIQGVHFAEEATTGFHEQFPALVGLPSMPFWAFVIFNLAWLGAWAISIPGVRSGHAAAFFAAWFLAIAGALNGIGHPLMAIAVGDYFPGLISSPFIGIACVWLWRRLQTATRPAADDHARI